MIHSLSKVHRIPEIGLIAKPMEIDLPSDMLSMQCLKFTLQPIVENAVKHGLEMQKHEGIITIEGEMTFQNAILIIKDNGYGMEPQTLENLNYTLRIGESSASSIEGSGKQGIGLLNVFNRLRLHYGKGARMDITSQKLKGTRVKLTIPTK